MSLPLITAANLRNIKNLRHAFSTREGGVSGGPYQSLNLGWASGDDDDQVQENYRILANELGTTLDRIVGVRQVHEAEVAKLSSLEEVETLAGKSADAVMTDRHQFYLCIRVADCFPILLVDPKRHAIAAAHAGWRGTLANVLPGCVESMSREYGTQPGDIHMAIGPGISMKNFEVSLGVAALFKDKLDLDSSEIRESDTGAFLNLEAINVRMAQRAGIPAAQIWNSKLCTFDDASKFFSYRRDGKHTGRCVGVIGWVA